MTQSAEEISTKYLWGCPCSFFSEKLARSLSYELYLAVVGPYQWTIKLKTCCGSKTEVRIKFVSERFCWGKIRTPNTLHPPPHYGLWGAGGEGGVSQCFLVISHLQKSAKPWHMWYSYASLSTSYFLDIAEMHVTQFPHAAQHHQTGTSRSWPLKKHLDKFLHCNPLDLLSIIILQAGWSCCLTLAAAGIWCIQLNYLQHCTGLCGDLHSSSPQNSSSFYSSQKARSEVLCSMSSDTSKLENC